MSEIENQCTKPVRVFVTTKLQDCRYRLVDTDREQGVSSKAHAYSQDGGLAVLSGNLKRKMAALFKTAVWMKIL